MPNFEFSGSPARKAKDYDISELEFSHLQEDAHNFNKAIKAESDHFEWNLTLGELKSNMPAVAQSGKVLFDEVMALQKNERHALIDLVRDENQKMMSENPMIAHLNVVMDNNQDINKFQLQIPVSNGKYAIVKELDYR